jgi:hypothetical protein
LCLPLCGDLEIVEAGAQHEGQLIPQDLPHRPQLAREAVPFPQQAGLGIGPAICELGKFKGDQVKAVEIGGHEVGRLPRRQAQADRAAKRQNGVPVLLLYFQPDDHRAHACQGRAGGGTNSSEKHQRRALDYSF